MVERIAGWERQLGLETNPDVAALQGVVGVARYRGEKPLTIDSLVTLTAMKFHQLQTA